MRESRRHLRQLTWFLVTWLLVYLFLANAALGGEVPFAPSVVIESSFTDPWDVAIADLDGDGDLDIVGSAEDDDTLAWWENSGGDASSWIRHDLSLAFGRARGLTVADLDGDGDTDVIATAFDDSVRWWENDLSSGAACGTDFCEHTIEPAFVGATWLTVADFDRDGDNDVVAMLRSLDDVTYYENVAGDASVWSSETIDTFFDGAQTVAVGDIDGDGDPDLVGGAAAGDGAFTWFENDLDGAGACATNWCEHQLDTGSTRGVEAADIDGDGDIDLVRGTNDDVAWWENTSGNGTTWSEHVIPGADSAISVTVADLDEDGDIDILPQEGFPHWLENVAGNGSTWTPRSIQSTGETYRLVAGDLDSDGDLDVAGVSRDGHDVVWWRNRALHRGVTFAENLLFTGATNGIWSVVPADVDRDGDLDIIAPTANVLSWAENNGTPDTSTWTEHFIDTSIGLSRQTVAVDVDGDRDIDVVISDTSADTILWYENDGTPADGLWTVHTLGSSFADAGYLEAADIDRDGDPDIVAGSITNHDLAWFINDGTPADSEWTRVLIEDDVRRPQHVEVGDLDGDGDPDVMVAATGSDDAVLWYENDGSPEGDGWTEHIVSDRGDPWDLDICDVDGDGDLDAVTGSEDGAYVGWFENDGSPASGPWTEHTISETVPEAQSVVCGDLDADGDADVAAGSFTNDFVAIFRNDGSPADGGWVREVDLDLPRPWLLAVADLDEDGRTDLLSGTFEAFEGMRWLQNLGGQFAVPTTDVLPSMILNEGTDDVALFLVEGVHRGRAGDEDAEIERLEVLFEESPGDPLLDAELVALVSGIHLYRDDDDGVFEPGLDDSEVQIGIAVINEGVVTLPLGDGSPAARLEWGGARAWWIAIDLRSNAGTASPDSFRATHLSATAARGEMHPDDLLLVLEPTPEVTTATLSVNATPVVVTPIADQMATTDEPFVLDVAANFDDPEGQALLFTADGLPASLSIADDGTISGQPSPFDVAGSPYTVTVTATDPFGLARDDVFVLTLELGATALFFDGFESGDTTAWSSAAP